MKQNTSFAQPSYALLLLSLIFCACNLMAQAQVPPDGTIIPTVCFESNPLTLTTTVVQTDVDGPRSIQVSSTIQIGIYSVLINPGSANEERLIGDGGGNTIYLTSTPVYTHATGETVVLTTAGDAVFGFHNTGSRSYTIPRSVSSGNYFTPGAISYPGQPSFFQVGRYDDVFRMKIIPGINIIWHLNGSIATASGSVEQACANITYQGRLSEAGSAANGQYDLRFTAFDSLTGGAAQSGSVVVENASVVNGVFTANLNFGSSFTNNYNAKFLEIAVRPGASSGADPFTVLTPRQPITSVSYAVNAQYAANTASLEGKSASGFLQNSTTPQTANFNISGNGAIGGNLSVSGTINGTVTNATNAENATNALNSMNADKLGGIAANQYLTTTSTPANLIQNTTSPQDANINVSGTITSGCRAGFTAIAGGRLCVSAMQSPALFVVAVDSCRGMTARVGNSTDAMVTFSQKGFNYFGDLSQGWLADHMGEKLWGTWNISFPNADFDGPPAASGINGVGPQLPYRCVY
jgi:hypothetical protein